MKLERLQILETFKVATPHGMVKVQGFRLDDFFALTPEMKRNGSVGSKPEFVTHIMTGFSPLRTHAFTFEQACLFARFLRALPVDWNGVAKGSLKGTGVTAEIVACLGDIAQAVRS